MRCPKCGSDENGRFCSKCGAEVRKKSGGGGGARCSKCGKGLEPKAMFCAECGEPTGHRPAKGPTAYLPWVLSGLALVAFAIALTLFIQGQTAVRVGDMPPTGALPVAERVNPDGTPVTGAAGAGPGGIDLGSMSPRQAADRLFDRVMREDEAGNEAQAQQFGYNNDYIGYVPLPYGSANSEHGLLCVNHEYTDEELMFAGYGRHDKGFSRLGREIVDIEMAAHGSDVGVFDRERIRRAIRFADTTVAEAIECAYSAVDRIDWKGVHFRKDIGRKALNR